MDRRACLTVLVVVGFLAVAASPATAVEAQAQYVDDFDPQGCPSGPFQLTKDVYTPAEFIGFDGELFWWYGGNACEATWAGMPTIVIDESQRKVELIIGPPSQFYCAMYIAQVCGLRGRFGPLPPGEWIFRSDPFEFILPFTVTDTPVATLRVQTTPLPVWINGSVHIYGEGEVIYDVQEQPRTLTLTAPIQGILDRQIYYKLDHWTVDGVDFPYGLTDIQIQMHDANRTAVASYHRYKSVMRIESVPLGIQITGDAPGKTKYTVYYDEPTAPSFIAPEFADLSDQRYKFVRWVLDDAAMPDGERTLGITPDGDHAAKAIYDQISRLTVKSYPFAGAFISGEPAGTADYVSYYEMPTAVTLTAPETMVHNEEVLSFHHWKIGALEQPFGQRTVSLTVDRHITAEAHYWHTVTFLSTPGAGIQTAYGTTPCTTTLAHSFQMKLTAPRYETVDGVCYSFVRWNIDGVDQPLRQRDITKNVSKAHRILSRWKLTGDVNGDCVVNVLDLILLRKYISTYAETNSALERLDVNDDGIVAIDDFMQAYQQVGKRCR